MPVGSSDSIVHWPGLMMLARRCQKKIKKGYGRSIPDEHIKNESCGTGSFRRGIDKVVHD